MSDLQTLFATLTNQVIPGGCDDCNAEQTLQPDPDHPNLWHCYIAHDDDCPTYKHIRQTQQPA